MFRRTLLALLAPVLALSMSVASAPSAEAVTATKCHGAFRVAPYTFKGSNNTRTVYIDATKNPVLPARSFCNKSSLAIKYRIDHYAVNGRRVKLPTVNGVPYFRTSSGRPQKIDVVWVGSQFMTVTPKVVRVSTTG